MMKKKKQYLHEFFKAVFAGIAIALAATGYLIIENELVGTVLFTIGLFIIYSMELNLYTGKVGFVLEDRNPLQVAVIWLGNLAGALFYTLCILNTRLADATELINHAIYKTEIKLSDDLLSMFIMAFFCGLLMYVAAKAYKFTHNTHNAVGGYVAMFLCVPMFLYLGFEHSVANMFYFSVAGLWTGEAIISLLVVSAGNAVGAVMLSAVSLIFSRKE